ncbi:CotH kinase family protein, partial [bacterium]|nr:CotH kinase family protein [candidate division CSSED10-310 bacterium]
NGVNVTGNKYYTATGAWQTWRTEVITGVALEAGQQVMRIMMDGNDFNINSFNIRIEKNLVYPEVVLTSPDDKSDYYRGDDIDITAEASDADGTITRVEFYADEDKIGEDRTSPYGMIWEDAPIGKWDLKVVAVDNDGAKTTSKKVDITVHYPDFQHDLVFFPERGFYDSNFTLQISTDLEGAIIQYTLNGDDPLEAASPYADASPVSIDINPSSTRGRGRTPGVVVRAVALLNGAQASKIMTHSYIFIDKVKTQSDPGGDWPDPGVNGQQWHYNMNASVVNNASYRDLIDDALLDIPTISIVTDLDNMFGYQDGIYVNAWFHGEDWERPCSVELINPDESEGFQINAGVRIRGGWSRHGNYPKHAFRLFFKEKYGKSKLKFPLFGEEGVDEFVKVDLRTSQNYAWSNGYVMENTMNRDVFSRELQREMGQPYTRSRYYHLYIDGMYWGLYQTQERPEANFAESYLGGDNDDYDVIKVDIGDDFNLYEIEATNGNKDAWRDVWDASQTGFSSNTNYFKLEGRTPDGEKDPDGRKLVDIDNLIDYMLIIFYTGNFDAPVSKFRGNQQPNNFYAIYNRSANEGFKFFQHDCEHTILVHDAPPGVGIRENRVNIGEINENPMYVGQLEYFHPQWLHYRLTDNDEYCIRFMDHVYKHFYNGGAMTPDRLVDLFRESSDMIEMAIIAESARWGDLNRSKLRAWQPTIHEIIDAYFPRRGEIVLDQLEEVDLFSFNLPPVFRQNGNEIAQLVFQISGTLSLELAHTAGSSGSIYYTLNGEDPRAVGGTPAAGALNAGNGITLSITASTQLKARTLRNGQWSALHELKLIGKDNLNVLRITEIHYHPLDEGAISGKEYEFIELKNTGNTELNISLATFVNGIDYTLPSGTILDPAQIIVISSNAGEFQNRYQFEPFGEYEGQLDNGGERLVLTTAAGDTLANVRYDDESPWPVEADTMGYSLVYKYIENDVSDQSNPASWRPSYNINGSPGADDLASAVDDIDIAIPDAYSVFQNYPNPFNPTTCIEFTLKADTKVKLSVFDITGKHIKT